MPLNSQSCVPIFPDRLVAEAADEFRDFLRRAFVADSELAGRIRRPAGLRYPFAGTGRKFLDDAAFGVMDFFLARAGVTARFRARTGAHHRYAERQQAVAQSWFLARREHDPDIGEHEAERADELRQFAIADVRERFEFARAGPQSRQRNCDLRLPAMSQ